MSPPFSPCAKGLGFPPLSFTRAPGIAPKQGYVRYAYIEGESVCAAYDHHPVCTAPMGPDADEGAVVDQYCRVRGGASLPAVDEARVPLKIAVAPLKK